MDVKIETSGIGVKFETEKVYPGLEDLVVDPSTEQQKFKSEKYGYDNVTVNAVKGKVLEITPTMEEQKFNGLYDTVNVKAIESEELNIVPSAEEQMKEGLFNKVKIAGDSDLIPENIKEGAEIFGIVGKAELKGEENAIIDGKKVLTNTSSNQNYVLLKMITKIPKNIDVSNWTSTAYLFSYCSALTNLNLSNFDTSKVVNMDYMFQGCSALTSLDLSNLNTGNVSRMSNMFQGCSALTNLNLSNFDTSKVVNMDYMFQGCSALTSLDLSSFNTSNVSYIEFMFQNCLALTSLDLSSFNISKINNMQYMFDNCKSLTNLDLSSFDMSKVRIIQYMFSNCSALVNLKSFKNLGKGYTSKSNNYRYYTLDLSSSINLTHESLMDVINNLYDLNLTYNVAGGGTLYTQSLTLGSKNLAKLTSDEIAIATNKRLDGFIERRTKR